MAQTVESPAQPYTVYDVDNTEVRGHTMPVARSPMMTVLVHRWKPGDGEVALHSHPFQDAAWTVLQGRVRFYGDQDNLLGDLGPHQGIFIPGGTYYWFENAGEGDLVMTRISTTVPEPLRKQEVGPLDEYGRTFKNRPGR